LGLNISVVVIVFRGLSLGSTAYSN
jgi:hypothetical protein